jgi:cysteine synthase A
MKTGSGRGILETIGNTPMLELSSISPGRTVFAKAEFLNPAGSIKDRVALHLIECAEKEGNLKSGMTIAEATSGNTGIGVAFVGIRKGYRVRIVMPEDMSEERKKIISAFGAELVPTPAADGIKGAVDRLDEMAANDDSIWVVGQFVNPHNPEIHYLTTGPEIWEQMGGVVDAFVAGVGSGGTLQGVGRLLRERKPGVRLIAVEPATSAALLGHEPGLHQIQGIGDGFVPDVLDTSIIDDVLTVTDDQAVDTTRAIAREEGALVGTSSGANVHAAVRVAEDLGEGKTVVTVLPDRAERYFSTALI